MHMPAQLNLIKQQFHIIQICAEIQIRQQMILTMNDQ